MTLAVGELWHRYGAREPWVLQNAWLDVQKGEVVGLHGPSGIGKSTLGRVVAGMETPTRGEITIHSEPDQHGNRSKQHPVQLVLQNAQAGMNPRWRIRDVLDEAVPDGAAAVDTELVLPGWLDRYPHEISGGELQRVNLARALLARPSVLVADEITASLDAVTQARLWQMLVERTRAEGIGVLIISHDHELLTAVADRIVDFADLSRST